MKLQFTRVVAIVAGALIGISAFAGGAADKVTGHFRHAGPVNDPGDVIYSKTISAHEAFAGRPQRGFIYAVRPDGAPRNFYEQATPLPVGFAEDAVYVDYRATIPCSADFAGPREVLPTRRGAYAATEIGVFATDPECWTTR